MPVEHRSPISLFDLSGKSVLITGATGALGQIAALSLANAGARLILTAGSSLALEKVAQSAAELGAEVQTINQRPDTEEHARAMVEAAVSFYGSLDLVVVASGTNIVHKIGDFELDEWRQVMDVNVLGSWLVCKAAASQFIKQGRGGKVVLISSTRGKLGHPAGYTAYCPSKSAIDGLVRSLACELGEYGITINAIAPTVFRSKLTAWMFSDVDPGKSTREAMLSRIPLGRLGEPEDLVGGLIYLLSPASSFCTGQTIYIDGGYTAG